MRRTTLVKALAYRLQADVHGDLSAPLRRELRALATPMVEKPRLGSAESLQPGARLLRTWRESLHEVIVRKDGFEWQGDLYPSLSRVAREITGVRWNGPRFFGLRERTKTEAQASNG